MITPTNHYEALAIDIMRRILSSELVAVRVTDIEVGNVVEQDVTMRWSCQAVEQISAVIAEYFELNMEVK